MLDGGPSRKLRIAERDAAQRPEASQYQPEATSQSQERYVSDSQAPERYARRQRSQKRFNLPIVFLSLVIVLATIGWALWYKPQSSNVAAPIERDKLQAVFMVGGQVYFGKLEILDNASMKLSNVFYIQSNTTEAGTSEDPQASSKDSSSMQLIKLGEEVHGPEDAMIINRDQVLFYENLKPGGKVSQLIQNYKSGNK